jgi:hypothetical protein
VRQGFVYERAPHITPKAIANNAEVDVIWETWERTLEPLREHLNTSTNKSFEEWEVPRENHRVHSFIDVHLARLRDVFALQWWHAPAYSCPTRATTALRR